MTLTLSEAGQNVVAGTFGRPMRRAGEALGSMSGQIIEVQTPMLRRCTAADVLTMAGEGGGPSGRHGCRNVVIYFTAAAKTDLYKRFCESLRVGGVLFLGATESIPNVRSVGLLPSGLTFYLPP